MYDVYLLAYLSHVAREIRSLSVHCANYVVYSFNTVVVVRSFDEIMRLRAKAALFIR